MVAFILNESRCKEIQSVGGACVGGDSLGSEKCEKIIDCAMGHAGLQISMEQWVAYSKTAARIGRLVIYAKV